MSLEPYNYLKVEVKCECCKKINKIMHLMDMESRYFRRMKVYHIGDKINDVFAENKTYHGTTKCGKCDDRIDYKFDIDAGKIVNFSLIPIE